MKFEKKTKQKQKQKKGRVETLAETQSAKTICFFVTVANIPAFKMAHSVIDYEQSLFPLRDSPTTLAARHARHVLTPQAISRSLARLLVPASTDPCQSGKRDFP